jgi:hypothetical protein
MLDRWISAINTDPTLTSQSRRGDQHGYKISVPHRVIPFVTPVSTNPQQVSHLADNGARLLKAARAAYSALLLAVPHGEQNTIVKTLGNAIRAADTSHNPLPPTPGSQGKPIAPVKMTAAVAAQLLHELHSERCVCGGANEARR